MKDDLYVKNGVVIPGHELEITASRAGGPGGQHVNKTSTRITVRWKVDTSNALTETQKDRILEKLHNELTNDHELIVHNGSTRSQHKNKELALEQLAHRVAKALHVPKKRMKTRISKKVKEERLKKKKERGEIKKMRGKVDY